MFISTDYNPNRPDGFRSHDLTRTDDNGRGTGGITAQVSLPKHLPMFGTTELQGYPIEVRISQNCVQHPYSFIAIMAHELSHVLLASLASPLKDSELHTDLVPIILGFGVVVGRGRRISEQKKSFLSTTTQTTTYGYLTDSQFDFAYGYVASTVQRHSDERRKLLTQLVTVEGKIRIATSDLLAFRECFDYLDHHPPRKMSREHAERVVELHARDYVEQWERHITQVSNEIAILKSFAQGLNHYTTSALVRIKEYKRAGEAAAEQLDQTTEAICRDKWALCKYVGFIWKLRQLLLTSIGLVKSRYYRVVAACRQNG